MTTVYLVKSFGYEGYKNLKVFADEERAVRYASGLGVPFADADDDLAPGTSEFQVADRLGCLVEAVGPVDDRHDLSVVCQLRKDEQVGTARSGRERHDPTDGAFNRAHGGRRAAHQRRIAPVLHRDV